MSAVLRGKTAVITGSLSGIGLGIARVFSRAGANIVVNGFAEKPHIDAVIKQLTTPANRVTFIHADLKKPTDSVSLIQQTVKEFGSVDILVNNAGMQHIDSIENFPDQKWEDIIALNLSSSFYTIKTAVPHMKKTNWGRIINVASAHGLVASIQKSGYVASKHGLVGLGKVVALELAKTGITCNTICPGFVLTPLIQAQIDMRVKEFGITEEQAKAKLLGDKQPSGQFCSPEDIGELALFLTSKAGSHITGCAYSIDGGWTAQ